MRKLFQHWWLRDVWASMAGPTGRCPEDREPFTWGYVEALTGLLVRRKLRVSTYVWALRARPSSVCGIGGTYAVAFWIKDRSI